MTTNDFDGDEFRRKREALLADMEPSVGEEPVPDAEKGEGSLFSCADCRYAGETARPGILPSCLLVDEPSEGRAGKGRIAYERESSAVADWRDQMQAWQEAKNVLETSDKTHFEAFGSATHPGECPYHKSRGSLALWQMKIKKR